MVGIYREKTCPKCGIKHRKQYKHCSKSCAYRGVKKHTPESKNKISAAQRKYMKETEKGQHRIEQARMQIEIYHAIGGKMLKPHELDLPLPIIFEEFPDLPPDYIPTGDW